MGKIVVSQNITVDGAVADPTGELGTANGGWFNRIDAGDREAWAAVGYAEAMGAEAFLMGRVTYDYLAARWPTRTGPWADRLNGLPKYVVSSTLADPQWANTSVLTGHVADEVARLRSNLAGEIVVAASRQLVQTLVAHDLVDELRLMVYPFVLGAGERLFDETGSTSTLRLVDATVVGSGLALLTYDVVRAG